MPPLYRSKHYGLTFACPPFLLQSINYFEDLVVDFPGTAQKHMANPGNVTPRNVKYYNKKITREHPTFQFQFFRHTDITEDQVRSILALRNCRFKHTNFSGGATRNVAVINAEVRRILALAKARNGLVGLATIGGQICGGQISYHVGTSGFASIIAHRPKYNHYCLGTTCCYLTICERIRQGVKEFHLKWGRNEYKYRFLGIQRDLDNIHIFWSWLYLTLHAHFAVANLGKGYLREIKLWLLAPKSCANWIAQFIFSENIILLTALEQNRRLNHGISRYLVG